MFSQYPVTLRQLAINTLPSYTSVSYCDQQKHNNLYQLSHCYMFRLYPITTVQEIIPSVFQALDFADRAHLLDIFSLAAAGLVNYTLAMDMTRYLPAETEYIPWSLASTKFRKFHTLLISSPSYAKLKVRK
jgi:hypothetical protein